MKIELEYVNNLSLAAAAEYYHDLGLTITPCLPKSKAAYIEGWNTPKFYETFDPVQHWRTHPNDNIGLVLEPSRCLSLDLDSVDEFKIAISSIGLTPQEGDLSVLETPTPGIKSGKPNRAKLIFQAPVNHDLVYHKLSWNKVGVKGKRSIFELRTGWVMDILPPSIHPDTQKAYEWVGVSGELKPLPSDLALLWSNWSGFEEDLIKADRNYIDEPKTLPRGRPRKAYTGRDYIGEWIDKTTLSSVLEDHGYYRIGRRFTSPFGSNPKNTSTVISEDKRRFFCFDTNDPFGDGYHHNAFDLILYYDHNNDFLEALARVKDDLGVNKIQDKELVEAIKKYGNFSKEEID